MSAYQELETRFKRMAALGEAECMLHWDMSVLMPAGGAASRIEQLSALKLTTHEMKTDPRLAELLEAAEAEVVEETPAADVEAVNADADAEVEVVEPPEAPEDVVEVVAPAAEPEPEPEPEPVVAADDIEPEAPAVPEVTEASEAPTGKKGKGKGKGKGKKGRR